tara:strand:- start:12386 stop:12751 length:366 start_codon:yes stop_codon:yes gene_type:complete
MDDKVKNLKEKHNLLITDTAINRINLIKNKEGKGFLRVTVDGGGCSGFSYSFSFDKKTKSDDVIAHSDKDGSPTLVTDNTSIIYLKGSKITWEENLNGATFTIDNPNATSSCGCGTSFSVT